MENHPKFDLTQAVTAWSRSGKPGAPQPPEEAARREASLMKIISELQSRGLKADEAFQIVISRLDGQELPEEQSAKTNNQSLWWARLSWAVGGVVVYDLLGAIIRYLSEIPGLIRGDPPWRQTWWGAATGLSVTVAWEIGVMAVLVSLQLKPAAAALGGKLLARLGKGRRPVLLVGLLALIEGGLIAARYARDVSQPFRPSEEALKEAVRINSQIAPYSVAWYWAWHLLLVAALVVVWMRHRRSLAAMVATPASLSAPATSSLSGILIQEWECRMAAQTGVTGEQARELGAHLRDSVEKISSLGLSQSESWWLARRRVGSVEDLAKELRIENPTAQWRQRVLWILFGWAALGTIYMIPMASSWLFTGSAGEPGGTQWRVIASMLPALIESVVCGLLLLSVVRRNAAAPFRPPSRDTMRVAGWFLAAVVCYFCLPWGGQRPLDRLVAGMMNFMDSPGLGQGFLARLQALFYSPVPSLSGGVTGFLVWLLVSGTSRSFLRIALLYALIRRAGGSAPGITRTPAPRPAFSET